MTVQPVSTETHAVWLRMRRALWPDCSEERHALEAQQLSASDGVVLIVSEENSARGFAEVSVRKDPVEGAAEAPIAYLEGWFVDEDFRGRGLGKALLEAAEKWAIERGFRELGSDAELYNAISINVHKACGFREISRTVHYIKEL